jgi:hypothetical protein
VSTSAIHETASSPAPPAAPLATVDDKHNVRRANLTCPAYEDVQRHWIVEIHDIVV